MFTTTDGTTKEEPAMNLKRRSSIRTCLTVLLLAGSLTAGAGETSPAADAFARIKTLAGTWTGEAKPFETDETFPVTHEFRVSANASVVMETMSPGTEHEMINMYHLDGDDLVLTHYCAAGNQPTMRLAGVSEDGRTLRFEFTGGSNLDPAVDDHIHEASLTLVDDDTLEESWVGYADGKPAGEALEFTLHRAE
jgi:hypothetical protein